MKKINKWFWLWQQEAEKAFLEEQALAGLLLSKVGFNKYIFRQSQPQSLVYQMDFKGLNNKIREKEYLQIYADTGWHLAARYGSWYYFYQEKKDDMDLSIFNDNKSKSEAYKRILIFLLITGFPLYYQTIIFIPILPLSESSFPGFYFFFRIIATILTLLHLFVLVKILLLYKKVRDNIKE